MFVSDYQIIKHTMSKRLRTYDVIPLGDVKYGFLESFTVDSKGLRQRQLPTGVEIISRILKLTKGESRTKNEAYSKVAEELSEFWIYGFNIYPLSIKRIKDKLKSIYEGVGGYQNIKKKGGNWQNKVKAFNDKMMTGFDIRTYEPARLKEFEEKYQVKMKTEDIDLWEDNCRQKVCQCSWETLVKCSQCPRQMITTTEVDEEWKSWLERKLKDKKQITNQSKKADDDEERMKKVDTDEAFSRSADPDLVELASESPVEIDDPSDDFTPPVPPTPCSASPWATRASSSISISSASEADAPTLEFPQIPLRTGRNKLNPIVMKAIVHCQSTYKISDNDIRGVIVDFMHMVCGQKWEKEAVFDSDT